jgi:hypothetical protein
MPANSDILQAALIGYQAQAARIEQAMAEIRRELQGSAGTTPSATPARAFVVAMATELRSNGDGVLR